MSVFRGGGGGGGGKGLSVSQRPGILMPYQLPPSLGTWENPVGIGVKKAPRKSKKGEGLLISLLGLPQSKSLNSISLLGQVI